MVPSKLPPVNPGGGGVIALSDDPRLEALADWLRATDNNDWKAGRIATRRLRDLGLSICLTKPSGDRSGS